LSFALLFRCFYAQYSQDSDILTTKDEVGKYAIRLASTSCDLTLLVVTVPNGEKGRQVLKYQLQSTAQGFVFREQSFSLLSEVVGFACTQKDLDMLVRKHQIESVNTPLLTNFFPKTPVCRVPHNKAVYQK